MGGIISGTLPAPILFSTHKGLILPRESCTNQWVRDSQPQGGIVYGLPWEQPLLSGTSGQVLGQPEFYPHD